MSESVAKPRTVSEMRQECIENDEKLYISLHTGIVDWLNDEIFQAVKKGVSVHECSTFLDRLHGGNFYKMDPFRVTEMTKNILIKMEINDPVISVSCPVQSPATITIRLTF